MSEKNISRIRRAKKSRIHIRDQESPRLTVYRSSKHFYAQIFDSFIVLYIAFGLGADWPINKILALCSLNYVYKCSAAIVLTPLLYLIHYIIDNYLGIDKSNELKKSAQEQ